ncbi:hypothetical protein CPB83DRAFT_629269 [Crepidotus variabilis]|uniref:Transmembrane protein n=1 Tax=Crepidotus variabilis TaxID=179855 RepID=A0A9P6EP60_9AGAR|nr:hypothetical protein CPB83DRAFT_629269 [Crepidotus variabilis]
MVFQIEYPVTRFVGGHKWLGPVSYLGAFIAIVMLTLVNVALVGYETVNLFSEDYNISISHWYDTFMPYRKAKPGTLCEPHLLNIGDHFTTNYTVFEWVVQSVALSGIPVGALSGVPYTGNLLNDCDVNMIYMNGDMARYSVQFSVVVSCKDNDSEVTAATSFTVSSLPGVMGDAFGVVSQSNSGALSNARPIVLSQLINNAAIDLGIRVQTALAVSNGATPIALSTLSSIDNFCPASLSSSDCGKQRPNISFIQSVSITPNNTLSQSFSTKLAANTTVIDALTEAPLLNLLQTVYAAARIDLGIDSPNNVFLHKEALPLVLNKTFPVTLNTPASIPAALTSNLYLDFEDPGQISPGWENVLPVEVAGPAVIRVLYLCRYQRRKSGGSLFISVLVAVLSMFTSGWGIYTKILTKWAKRSPGSNSCENHQFKEPYRTLEQSATPDEKFVG